MFKLIYQTKQIPEVCKQVVLEEAVKFAYDPQLPLFPDHEVEKARTELKEFFESGGSIESISIQISENKYANLEGIANLGLRIKGIK